MRILQLGLWQNHSKSSSRVGPLEESSSRVVFVHNESHVVFACHRQVTLAQEYSLIRELIHCINMNELRCATVEDQTGIIVPINPRSDGFLDPQRTTCDACLCQQVDVHLLDF